VWIGTSRIADVPEADWQPGMKVPSEPSTNPLKRPLQVDERWLMLVFLSALLEHSNFISFGVIDCKIGMLPDACFRGTCAARRSRTCSTGGRSITASSLTRTRASRHTSATFGIYSFDSHPVNF
jgi:hypothetical protein